MNNITRQVPLSGSTVKFFLLLLLLALISFSYQPALNGPFVFDDQVNILENPAVILPDLSFASLKNALLSNESGALKRVLPALSFGLNHYQAQGFNNTFIFKLTNLSIHLLNALLVFSLMLQLAPKLFKPSQISLTEKQTLLLAFFIALLWAIHPLQVSTVAYIVQRMTSMATGFVLLGLNGYVWARNRLELNKRFALPWLIFALVLGTGLGLLCKENAALLVLYTATIEFCFYTQQGKERKMLSVYALLLGIPLLLAAYLILSGKFDFSAGFYAKPFTLEQRLLTEARVLWFYVQMLLFPDIRVMGLFHDDLPLSKSWLEPITTLFSIIAWGIMLILAWWCKRKQPVVSFAIIWFLVGQSMESTIWPLEIVYEHRNYLPSLGIIMLFVVTITTGTLSLWQRPSNTLVIAYTLLSISSLILIALTYQRASYWQSEASLFKSLATHHPQSPISLYSYAELLNKKEDKPDEAYRYYLKAVALNKDSASLGMQATLSAPMTTAIDPLLDSQKLFILLNKRNPTPFDLAILNDATQCVLSKLARCANHLHDVRNWLNASIDNRFLSQEWRRVYVHSLFDIEMQYGLASAALQTVTKAQAQDPQVFQYYLMKADALRASGQYPQALTLINTAEQLAQRYNPALLNDVYQLKNQVLQQQ
ncbi:MAG: tetratricopeptide repeat protein [Methylococcaceae bacterium]|nr:tetratricopeptide repeat protein [Methylococcaceae bacterium]